MSIASVEPEEWAIWVWQLHSLTTRTEIWSRNLSNSWPSPTKSCLAGWSHWPWNPILTALAIAEEAEESQTSHPGITEWRAGPTIRAEERGTTMVVEGETVVEEAVEVIGLDPLAPVDMEEVTILLEVEEMSIGGIRISRFQFFSLRGRKSFHLIFIIMCLLKTKKLRAEDSLKVGQLFRNVF